jgi:Zn-dependent protease/predicted transcriptional regulator
LSTLVVLKSVALTTPDDRVLASGARSSGDFYFEVDYDRRRHCAPQRSGFHDFRHYLHGDIRKRRIDRMRWSLTIGRFKGTAVKIHVTFILFLAWIGFSAYQRGGAIAARDSVLFIVAIFACVVLHEFGHILTARRYGIVADEVTLLPIGGVANISRMPEKPYEELLIALAGPAVNVVIAALLFVAAGAIDPITLSHVEDPKIGLAERLAVTNLFIAIFNMIPAFPMDGGRVLRAGLAMWLGWDSATRIAAQIGQAFAFVLGFLGLFGNPLLVFIAIFVYIAAAGEAQMSFMSSATRDIRVEDAMETQIATIDRGATIGEAVETLLATSQDEFPVLDHGRRLVGLMTRADIIEALKDADAVAPIAPFVSRDVQTIAPGESMDAALQRLHGVSSLGVVDDQGALVGLITRQSVAEIVLIKNVRPDWRFRRA